MKNKKKKPSAKLWNKIKHHLRPNMFWFVSGKKKNSARIKWWTHRTISIFLSSVRWPVVMKTKHLVHIMVLGGGGVTNDGDLMPRFIFLHSLTLYTKPVGWGCRIRRRHFYRRVRPSPTNEATCWPWAATRDDWWQDTGSKKSVTRQSKGSRDLTVIGRRSERPNPIHRWVLSLVTIQLSRQCSSNCGKQTPILIQF